MEFERVKKLLKGKASRILSLYCGDGKDIAAIGRHLKSHVYGIEKDRKKGNKAASVLNKVLKGCTLEDVRISPASFGLIMFNYPEIDNEDIARMTHYLTPLGVMIVTLPRGKLSMIAAPFAYRYENITFIPAGASLTMIGKRKSSPVRDKYMEDLLKTYSSGAAEAIPTEYVYEIPQVSAPLSFISTMITPEDMAEELAQSDLSEEVDKQYLTPPKKKVLKCLMPPALGHLAKIAANGDMDGLAEKDGQRIISKGYTKKIIRSRKDIDTDMGDEIDVSTEAIEVYIRAFDLDNGNLIQTRLA